MSREYVPIPEPEENVLIPEPQSTINETVSISNTNNHLPYPAEQFSVEYLSNQTLDTLKTMKKVCKIRAKTIETVADYTRIINEWYLKNSVKCLAKQKNPIQLTMSEPLNLDLTILPDNNILTINQTIVQTKIRKEKPKLYNFSETELEQYKKHIISTRESMYDKVHQIHNFLRNKGAGYGMYALKVFNLFWGLRKIEDMQLIEKLNLTTIPKFSDLLKLAYESSTTKHDELKSLVTGPILDRLAQPDTRNLLFYEIPTHILPSVYAGIVKLIDDLANAELSNNFQLSGKIYEYFVGRDATAISELGAYFTDRHITNWIYKNLCTATVAPDGIIQTMIDPFGGSGGFTTGYIMNMIEKSKQHEISINWNTELHKVFHYDINYDVLNSAALEFLCLTKTIPNVGNHGNIKYNNSFESDFAYSGTIRNDIMKSKYIITNPPYGGDTIKSSENKDRNAKISAYITKQLNEATLTQEEIEIFHRQLSALKQLDNLERTELEMHKVKFESCSRNLRQYIQNTLGFSERDAIAKFNDKEACSLALLMMLVDDDGEVIGVLKEGVFFDGCYSELRRKLITMFNVSDVISVPANEFENTTTKTSILKFRNTMNKISDVRFGELIVERFTEDKFIMQNGIVCLDELKGSISAVKCKTVSIATREQILAHPICSLNGKEYANREIIPGDGYKMVALGDLCELGTTTKHCANIGKINGKYKFYCSSKIQNLYVDFCEYSNLNIIIGQGGNFNVHIDKNFTPSKHVCVLKEKTNNEPVLKFIYNIIYIVGESGFIRNGSTIKWLNKENIKKFKIPIPESQDVLNSWVSRLSEAYDTRLEKEQRAKELEEQVMARIKEITETEDCDEVKFNDTLVYKSKKTNFKATDGAIYGLYKFYTSSQDKILYRNDYEFDEKCIIIGRSGLSSIHMDSKFSVAHDDVYVLVSINYINYIYYYLKNNISMINFKGSTIKHCSKNELSKLIIKLPKNKQLITDLEPTFQEIETLKADAQSADKRYNILLNELKAEAIKAMPADYMEDVQDTAQNEPETE